MTQTPTYDISADKNAGNAAQGQFYNSTLTQILNQSQIDPTKALFLTDFRL